MAAVPLALIAGGSYVWVTGGRFQETDNANLRQARVTIASEASGRIVETQIADNKPVKAGETLFVVDPEPYRIALAQADAALAAARLNVEQLRAAYSQAQAQEKVAAGEADYFQSELDRQAALSKKGVSTQATLDSARRDLLKAQDELAAAQQSVIGAKAALGGDPAIETDKHPTVLAALAARDKAAYDLKQTIVSAPADGVVYQAASFKPGQLVAAGTPLFTLVETGESWVDANFKETQLTQSEGRTAGGSDARHVPGQGASRHGRFHRCWHRRGVLAAAGAKCDRQLGQGHPAHPGAAEGRVRGRGSVAADRHERHRRGRYRRRPWFRRAGEAADRLALIAAALTGAKMSFLFIEL